MNNIVDFVAHQLGVSPAQMNKLMKGLSVQIPHIKLGSGAGDTILHLLPKNAKKLLSAYKKMKGVRIALTPEEIEHTLMKEGGKINRLNKFKRWTGAIGDFLKPVAQPILEALTNQAVNNIDAYGNANADSADPYGAFFGRGKKKRGGKLLIDQPFTARQAVNTIGDFTKDPAKTVGFGARKGLPAKYKGGGKLLIDQPFTARQAVNTIGDFTKDPAKTVGFGTVGYPTTSARGGYGTSGYGAIKRRGRPPKSGLGIATQSKAYRTAMRINQGGLEIDKPVIANEPISKYKTNPKVKPSSSAMTFSPYQNINSPAMNPFVPKSSYQQGGVNYNC